LIEETIVDVEQLLALFHLQAGSASISTEQLADLLGVSGAEAESIVDGLLENRLVEFTEVSGSPSPTLAATAVGRVRLLDDMAHLNGSLHRVLGGFDAEERTTILAFLSDIAPQPRS
jgi:DNA-binding MarR family transcriptional regulator